jgi:RimJ/RimL family protein N-acetyltransferase
MNDRQRLTYAVIEEAHFAAESITLKDGTPVVIRAIQAADAPRLQFFVAQLSPQTSYLRFLCSHKVLTDHEAAHLAKVDYDYRMALVATRVTNDAEQVIAVARYARQPFDPHLAEVAIVVADAYQALGLGTQLTRRLVGYARQHGIHTFTGVISSANIQMRHFLRRLGLPVKVVSIDQGDMEIHINLDEATEQA